MPWFKNIQIEKPVQVLPGYLLYRSHEIMGVNDLKLVLMQKVLKSPEEKVVFHDEAQHMEDSSPFGIGVAVEVILSTVISIKDYGTNISCMGLL